MNFCSVECPIVVLINNNQLIHILGIVHELVILQYNAFHVVTK